MRYLGIIGLIVALFMLPGVSPAVQDANPPDQQQTAVGQTPPRLSFVDGQVSFRRPGSQDWTQAQLNTPLAAGDQLYTGSPGNLELQIGSRAFVRAWADTQLELKNQEPDFLRFEVTTGYVAFDLRTVEPGRTIMVDTPTAAFTIEDAGYYRVDVNSDGTSFITRRGGRAAVTAGSGRSLIIAPSEEVVIEGPASRQITAYMAPPLDEWDNWNYARTDHLLETLSARYVSPEIYGAGDLDAYGTWRTVSGRGPVWVPTAVPPGWVPYSTGAWIMDPHYGWTWVDAEPWGWAPYHYGRWAFVDGFWGWAPGPVQVRPVYAPALVAFFGGPDARRARRWLGGTRVGRAAYSLVGTDGLHPSTLVGRLGRSACRKQQGHQPDNRGECSKYHRLPQCRRAQRLGDGQRESFRPRSHWIGPHSPGGCKEFSAAPHPAPDQRGACKFQT